MLPQNRACDRNPAVLLVPLECERAAFAVLPQGPLRGFNSSKFSSGHYHVKAAEWPLRDAEDVRALRFGDLKRDGAFPNYDMFYDNPATRALVASLYAEDLALYARACRQPWLAGADACAAQCRRVLTCHDEAAAEGGTEDDEAAAEGETEDAERDPNGEIKAEIAALEATLKETRLALSRANSAADGCSDSQS